MIILPIFCYEYPTNLLQIKLPSGHLCSRKAIQTMCLFSFREPVMLPLSNMRYKKLYLKKIKKGGSVEPCNMLFVLKCEKHNRLGVPCSR